MSVMAAVELRGTRINTLVDSWLLVGDFNAKHPESPYMPDDEKAPTLLFADTRNTKLLYEDSRKH